MSLSISDGEPSTKPFEARPSLLDTNLWLPSIPRSDLNFLGVDPPPCSYTSQDDPVSVAIFGPDARTLRRVRGIRVWGNQCGSSRIGGLDVLFSHGIPPVHLGQEWDAQRCHHPRLVFDVDGEGGELILGLEVTYSRSSGSSVKLKVGTLVQMIPRCTCNGLMMGLFWGQWLMSGRHRASEQIHTSKGRDVQFPESKPEGALLGPHKYIPKNLYRVKRLLPEGGTVVGFCSRAVRYAPSPPPPPSFLPDLNSFQG